MTVPELLRRRAADDPDRLALYVDGEDGLTFAEWDRRSDDVTRGLLAAGIRRGDRIGLLFHSKGWIDYAIAYLAVHKAGAAAIHLSDRMSLEDAEHRLRAGRANALIHGDSVFAGFSGLDWMTTARNLVRRGDQVDLLVRSEDLADIAFTSGTTLAPKAIAVTHGNLCHGRGAAPDERLFPGEEMFLSAWHMGTNASQATLVSAITAHPTVVATSSLDPGHLGQLIDELPIGGVMLPPSLAAAFADARLADRFDLSGVRAIGTGSAPVPPAIRVMLGRMFPSAVINVMYSSAEASPAFTGISLPPAAVGEWNDVQLSSVGLPGRDTELVIAGEDGEPLPPGEVGEVLMRSKAPLRQYDRDPSPDPGDGWAHTGDLGWRDEQGHVYLFDRISETVTLPDRRVSTQAVEAALYEHPGVREAAAYADGNALTAAIVARGDVTAEQLTVFLSGRLDPVEIPARLHLMESLPRNLMGKVVKRMLPSR